MLENELSKLLKKFRYKYGEENFAIKYLDNFPDIPCPNFISTFSTYSLALVASLILLYIISPTRFSPLLLIFTLLIFTVSLYKTTKITLENEYLLVKKGVFSYKIKFEDIIEIKKQDFTHTDIEYDFHWFLTRRHRNLNYKGIYIYCFKNSRKHRLYIPLSFSRQSSIFKTFDKYHHTNYNNSELEQISKVFITKKDLLDNLVEQSDLIMSKNIHSEFNNNLQFNSLNDIEFEKINNNNTLITKILINNKTYYLCDIFKKKNFDKYRTNLQKDFSFESIKFFETQISNNDYAEVWIEENELFKNKKNIMSYVKNGLSRNIAKTFLFLIIALIILGFIALMILIITK